MTKRKKPLILFLMTVLFLSGCSGAQNTSKLSVQDGKEVSFSYTLKVDGQIIDTSKRSYVQGKGEIIPGLENGLKGMVAGEEKEIIIDPEDAYGEVDARGFREVPIEELPPNIKPEVGMTLQAKNQNGKSQIIRIVDVKDKTVILDFNHPLAGKQLDFNVQVVSIK